MRQHEVKPVICCLTARQHNGDRKPLCRSALPSLYRELLNSASRNRASVASERARGCTGLVKLICNENKDIPMIGGLHPVVWVVQFDQHAVCMVSVNLGAMVAERLFGMSSNSWELSYNPQHGAACFRAFPESVQLRRKKNSGVKRGSVSVSNRIFEAWSKIPRISHAMVSARYSMRGCSVWIIFPLCAAWRATAWWKRCYEGLRGARVVSPFF